MPEKFVPPYHAVFDRLDVCAAFTQFSWDWQMDLCFYRYGNREHLENGGKNLLPIAQQEKINGYSGRASALGFKFGAGHNGFEDLEDNQKFIYANLCAKFRFPLPEIED
jgi:hypothetical protein